jgi:DNA-damage-inducible protein D
VRGGEIELKGNPAGTILNSPPPIRILWSSRDFTKVLDYSGYRNFEQVIAKAHTAYFNSGQRIDDHFVDVTEMVDLGSGAKQRQNRSICQLFPFWKQLPTTPWWR